MNIKLVRESVLNSIEPIARKIGFDRSCNKFFLINKDVLYQEIVISVSNMGSSYVVEPLLYVYWKEFSRNFFDFSEYMYDNGLSLEKPKKDCAILILQFRSIAENICMKNYESMFISGEAHPMDMHRTLRDRYEKCLSEASNTLSSIEGIYKWVLSFKATSGAWGLFAEAILMESLKGKDKSCAWAKTKLQQNLPIYQAESLRFFVVRKCGGLR